MEIYGKLLIDAASSFFITGFCCIKKFHQRFIASKIPLPLCIIKIFSQDKSDDGDG
ncbi:MAG: hypothetical protein R2941_24025 [Desulfobacterales bacterium]